MHFSHQAVSAKTVKYDHFLDHFCKSKIRVPFYQKYTFHDHLGFISEKCNENEIKNEVKNEWKIDGKGQM